MLFSGLKSGDNSTLIQLAFKNSSLFKENIAEYIRVFLVGLLDNMRVYIAGS